MEHLAIMKKSWGLTEKILTGEKTVESRWYTSKRTPWGRIEAGDTVYFKNSGEPVKIAADVEKVIQMDGLDEGKVREILEEYGERDGIEKSHRRFYFDAFRDKAYCMLIFLKNPREVEPFDIDKTGFGAMSAWITVDRISRIRKKESARTRHVGTGQSPNRAG